MDLTSSSSSSSSSGNSEKRASSPFDDEITFFVENDPSPDPKSDNEDEGDPDELLTKTSIYVGKDLPPEDDIGFSHYKEEEEIVGAKKRKQPEEELDPERQYTRYQTNDASLPPKNNFQKNAKGTSGANLYSFKSCTPFKIITMLWMLCHYKMTPLLWLSMRLWTVVWCMSWTLHLGHT